MFSPQPKQSSDFGPANHLTFIRVKAADLDRPLNSRRPQANLIKPLDIVDVNPRESLGRPIWFSFSQQINESSSAVKLLQEIMAESGLPFTESSLSDDELLCFFDIIHNTRAEVDPINQGMRASFGRKLSRNSTTAKPVLILLQASTHNGPLAKPLEESATSQLKASQVLFSSITFEYVDSGIRYWWTERNHRERLIESLKRTFDSLSTPSKKSFRVK